MSRSRFICTCAVGHVPRHVLHVLVFLCTCNLLLVLNWTSLQESGFEPEIYEVVIDESDSKPFIKRRIIRDRHKLEWNRANTQTRAEPHTRRMGFNYRPENTEIHLKNNSLLFRNLQSISREIQDNVNVVVGLIRQASEENTVHIHVGSHNDPVYFHNDPVGPRNDVLAPHNKGILLEKLQPAHSSQPAQLNTDWIDGETRKGGLVKGEEGMKGMEERFRRVLAGGHDNPGRSGTPRVLNHSDTNSSQVPSSPSQQAAALRGRDRTLSRVGAYAGLSSDNTLLGVSYDPSYQQKQHQVLFKQKPRDPRFREQSRDPPFQELSRDIFIQGKGHGVSFHNQPLDPSPQEPPVQPPELQFQSIRYMHNPLDTCAPNNEDGRRAHSLLLVHSAPGNKPQREAIRSTWGRHAARIVREEEAGSIQLRVVFVLGAPPESESSAGVLERARVRREAALYRDLLVGDFSDTYANLTLKALFALRWAHTHCNSTVYTLKTDDDTFLHVEALRTVLSGPRLPPLFGALNADAAVERVGRWGVSRTLFPAVHYPPYCTGCLYALATRLLPALLAAAHSVTSIPFEDVYVTGLLAGHVGVTCRQHAAFPQWHESAARLCERCRLARGELLGLHAVPPESMRDLSEMVNSGGPANHCSTTL